MAGQVGNLSAQQAPEYIDSIGAASPVDSSNNIVIEYKYDA